MKIRHTLDVAEFTHEEVVAALMDFARKRTDREVESVHLSFTNQDHRGTQYELSARLKDQPKEAI